MEGGGGAYCILRTEWASSESSRTVRESDIPTTVCDGCWGGWTRASTRMISRWEMPQMICKELDDLVSDCLEI